MVNERANAGVATSRQGVSRGNARRLVGPADPRSLSEYCLFKETFK